MDYPRVFFELLLGDPGRRFQSPVRMPAISAMRLINVKELEPSNTL